MSQNVPTRAPRDIRRAKKLSLIRVAVDVGSSEATTRLYEADRMAVSEAKRETFDAYYASLERELSA